MFSDNLKCIKQNNKYLANNVSRIPLEKASETVSVLETASKDYVLLKNGKPVENIDNPILTIKKQWETIKKPLNKYDFIIVFGLGMGHLLDFVHSKTTARIILYEPDLNIVRFTMEYVDLTKYFADNRLLITDNWVDCTNYIREKYLLEDRVEFMYLENYVLQRTKEFQVLTDKVYKVCQETIVDLNTIKLNTKNWIHNIIGSINYPVDKVPFCLLENLVKGKTALVLGAGPSLKSNIEEIKANRDKFLIFAIGRALKFLQEQGVCPDFAVTCDANYVSHTISKTNPDLPKINFITDVKSDNCVYEFNAKRFFTYFPKNENFSTKLAEKLPNFIKQYNTAGTATFCAYNCAIQLGCTDIVFAGLDLAFQNDIAYVDNSLVVANTQSSVLINKVPRNLTTVKSVTGEMVPTRVDYAVFIPQFEELIKTKKSGVKIYNITDFGAYIEGMTYLPLKEVLKKVDISGTSDLDTKILDRLIEKNYSQSEVNNCYRSILNEELTLIEPTIKAIDEWYEFYLQVPTFFENATKIITQIPVKSILNTYIQIELLKFTKMIFENDNEKKKEFLTDLFTIIKNFYKQILTVCE